MPVRQVAFRWNETGCYLSEADRLYRLILCEFTSAWLRIFSVPDGNLLCGFTINPDPCFPQY